MTSAPFPERFPIFPLPDCVLFPGVQLPLHVFEPRYRQMMRDCMRGERVIGMTLLRPGSDAASRRADVFEVGCAGRVGQCRELPDGRFTLVLTGERRFTIRRELDNPEAYRIVEATLLPDPSYGSLSTEAQERLELDRVRAIDAVLELARRSAPDSADALAEQLRTLDAIELVHALAFGLDVGSVEKQGLLEAPDPVERASMLIRLLDFRRAELEHPEAPNAVN